MKIAVVGSGISGLSAAYYLSKKHKVDLFEKDNHFGGHSYTVDLNLDNQKTSVDIGFIVFNYKTYPNLINFFKENSIEIEKSDMSFSVSVKDTNFEYCGKGISGIFSNKSNLYNLKFLKMFLDLLKFYKKNDNLNLQDNNLTLGDYLKKEKLSKEFIDYHIIPMVAAIWSMPPYEANQMPLSFFLKFFQNHGLFKLKNRPQWYTVSNRSRAYVNNILKKISGEYYKNYKINLIKRYKKSIEIFYGEKNEFFTYDKVVLATHADEALSILDTPTNDEKNLLSAFKYKTNIAVIHTDNSQMPLNKKAWSAWNAKLGKNVKQNSSITYWLNLLQNLKIDKDVFLSLNPFDKIEEQNILNKVTFTHPYFDKIALENQARLKKIQNINNTLFCGSYFGYGFHEDGITSTIDMLKSIYD
ncbi:FAD-dependent oxidoreductase [Candidatus Pelagibacter sp.]|nr:FAD-dependent oxidoreductase [Candidatus Pelagibacter sp.]|tara:strand:+ start:97 stop:1335 length:1239 start_codon:yes stop_codon:yes gene_type:complete